MPTRSTVTTPTRLPNYGNEYTALANLSASADANINSVVSLLHFNGVNGSTSIECSDIEPHDWTAFGNAQISTAQSKFGGSSLALDGAGDYIKATAPAVNFAFYNNDFTIEMWVYFNSVTGTFVLYEGRAGVNAVVPTIYVTGGLLRHLVNGTDRILSATTISTGTWNHIAVSRVSGITRMFLNGVQQGISFTDTNNYAASQPGIGAGGFTFSEFYLNGFVDDVRITNGVGRYSANFTPPTVAFPDPAAVTLPSGTSNSTIYTVRNTSTTVPLTVNSVTTIDGVKTRVVAPGDLLVAQADGANWRTVGDTVSKSLARTALRQGTNMATNPGFENPNLFMPITPGAFFSTEQKRSGTRSLKTVPGTGWSMWREMFTDETGSIALPCLGGDQFYIEFWAYGHANNPAISGYGAAHFQTFDSAGTNLQTTYFVNITAAQLDATKGVWTKFGGYVDAHANAATCQVTIYPDNITNGTFYWDDFSIYRVTLPPSAVTVTGTQALTNKTLTTPTITNPVITGSVTINGNNAVNRNAAVPATATSTGIVGQVAYDSTWFYVCTAANTWRRVALSTW
jgi:hypothetical protein